MSLTVATKDLRRALLAVLPHAYKSPSSADGDHRLERMRFVVTGQNLSVFATDTRTVGLAIVSMWGDDDGDEAGLTWDLSTESVRKLLAVHKPVKVPAQGGEFEPEQTVLITVEDGGQGTQLRTADVSGLLPIGEELVLPVLGTEEQFPDLEGYLGEAVYEHQHLGAMYDGQPLLAAFARFDPAVKAYGRPMAVRIAGHSRHRFIVTVGESFIGAVSVQHAADKLTDHQEEVITAWDGWVARLPKHMDRNPSSSSDTAWRPPGHEPDEVPDEENEPDDVAEDSTEDSTDVDDAESPGRPRHLNPVT